jgi:hypothetical protein
MCTYWKAKPWFTATSISLKNNCGCTSCVVEEKVQVAPRGSNIKVLAFEKLGNFLDLDENHVV